MCSVIIILVCNVFFQRHEYLGHISRLVTTDVTEQVFSVVVVPRSPVTFTFNLSSLPPFIHHPSGTCGRVSWRCWPPSSSATAASSPDPLPPANLLFQENWPATLELCIGGAASIFGWVGISDMCRWRTAPLMWQSTRSLVSSRYPTTVRIKMKLSYREWQAQVAGLS